MKLYDALTEKDISMIGDYISEYAGVSHYDSDININANLSHILRIWDENKQNLFKAFGEKFILSREVEVFKGQELMYDEMDNLIRCHNFISEYRTLAQSLHGYKYQVQNKNIDEACDYHISDGKNIALEMYQLIDTDALLDNVYTGETFELYNPKTRKTTKINKGCKAMRALGKIAAAYDFDFEDFRQKHSQILNQKKLRGTLCLSIHPLDYMTMSDNNCDWDSCMSWTGYGEFRHGTVEMMNSPYMVVAYLKSESPYKFYKHEWSNKKWRQLFIVSPEILMGIKPYPYLNEDLTGCSLQWLRELVNGREEYGNYSPNTSLVSNFRENIFAEMDKKTYISFNMSHMYNDINVNHLAYISDKMPDARFEINLSGPCECMSCGEVLSRYDIEPSQVVCSHCSGMVQCRECGEWISLDYAMQLGDSYYCECCADYYTTTCSHCEGVYAREDCRRVYVKYNDEIQNYTYADLCEDCYDAMKNLIHRRDGYYSWDFKEYVNFSDLNDHQKRVFDCDDFEDESPEVSDENKAS
jgi:hypothetical protein